MKFLSHTLAVLLLALASGFAAAAEASPPEAPLDVRALKSRLRDTDAIGLMTKLSLKKQVEDLVAQFRAHHQGAQDISLASLRPPYDALVMKAVSSLQQGDPALARIISGSREAIWQILADPQTFNSSS